MRILLLMASLLMATSPAFAGKRDLIDSAGVNLMKQDTVYTLTNLHPDDVHGRLYAVNYQQAGLIPMCSAVKLDAKNKKVLKFTVKKTNKQYQYIYHKAAAEKFPAHLLRFFGASCPKAEMKALGKRDAEGLRRGKALKGMTKKGVILAIGHPPKHVNPTPMESDSWTYWSNRFNRFLVEFDSKGKVSRIVE